MQVEECCQCLLNYFLPRVDEKRSGACIDVGVGTFAFYCELFASLGFPTVAVEPVPVNELRQICRRHKIKLVEACLSDIDGTQTLHIGVFEGKENYNLSSLNRDWWGASTKTHHVRSITLTKLFSIIKAKRTTCLKLDVEGAESMVIRQLPLLPESLLPSVIMFEYGGGGARESGLAAWSPEYLAATTECLDILKQSGYGFSIGIDSASQTNERVFDLRTSRLGTEEIFDIRAIFGNIITFRTDSFPKEEIASLCVPYYQ
jgi:FkbM family methyltransferase